MRLTLVVAFAALMSAAPLCLAPAYADAIPMPEELDAEQQLLIGVWQEEAPLLPSGLGHGFMLRTVAVGNTDMTILQFGGIAPSEMYSTSATRGTWTAKRQDDTTLIITLDQGEGRGTVLNLVFDGTDAFTLVNAETDRYPASRFRRVPPSGTRAAP